MYIIYDIESTQTVDYKTQPSTIEDTREDVQAVISVIISLGVMVMSTIYRNKHQKIH